MSLAARTQPLREVDSFGTLWQQYQLAEDMSPQVTLVEERAGLPLQIRIAPTSVENIQVIQALQKRVTLLLQSPRAEHKDLKGASRLLYVFEKKVKAELNPDLPIAIMRERMLQINEFAVLQLHLFQRIIGHDPDMTETINLSMKMGFSSYALMSIKENSSFFLLLEESYRPVFLSFLFFKREIQVIQELFMHEELHQLLCEQICHVEAPLIQEVITFLIDKGEREEGKKNIIIKAFSHLLEKFPQVLAPQIAVKLRDWSLYIDPEEELVPGKALSAIFCSLKYPPVAHEGALNTFLQRSKEESSSDELCRSFLALPKIKAFAPSLKSENFPVSFNVVEAAIWFRVPIGQLSSMMPFALVEKELDKCRSHFSNAVYEKFLFSCWSVNPRHYQEKCYESPTSVPAGMTVNDLLRLYEELSPVPVEEIEGAGGVIIKREELDEYVNKVITRRPYLGTPPAGSVALEDFYKTIEIYLCHTIQLLRVKNSREHTLAFLKEIADASSHCGGRYYGAALSEYFKISGQGDSSRQKILRSLADLRKTVFEQIVLKNESHNVHFLTRALRDHGIRLGIPGAIAAVGFRDTFGKNMTQREVDVPFQEAYSVIEMVHWICPSPKAQETRDLLIDYLGDRPPLGWKVEMYSTIRNQVESILSEEKKSPEVKIKAAWDCLSQMEIVQQQNESPQEAIRMAQRSSFIQEYLHNEEYEISPVALLHVLADIGLINCLFRQENSFFREKEGTKKAADFFKEFAQSVGSCVKGILGVH
jgi:hypothetical protein